MKAFVLSERWSRVSCWDTNAAPMLSFKIQNALTVLCKPHFCTIRASFRLTVPHQAQHSAQHSAYVFMLSVVDRRNLLFAEKWALAGSLSQRGARFQEQGQGQITKVPENLSELLGRFSDFARSWDGFNKVTILIKLRCLNDILSIDAIISG